VGGTKREPLRDFVSEIRKRFEFLVRGDEVRPRIERLEQILKVGSGQQCQVEFWQLREERGDLGRIREGREAVDSNPRMAVDRLQGAHRMMAQAGDRLHEAGRLVGWEVGEGYVAPG
jgi:hypothetical protein